MTSARTLLAVGAVTEAFVAGSMCGASWARLGLRGGSIRYTLPRPHLVRTYEGIGVLPAGTVLMYRDSLPEGGDFYDITLRVHAELDTTTVSDPDRIVPLHWHSRERPTAEGLGALLRSLGMTRREVEAVLPELPE